jgi:hypothetical protein
MFICAKRNIGKINQRLRSLATLRGWVEMGETEEMRKRWSY